jgi:hypothetical protein
MSELHVGDRVSWNTSQGRTRGRIVERHERDLDFDGQHFTASRDDPAFMIESEKTGARAVHKSGALRRLTGA